MLLITIVNGTLVSAAISAIDRAQALVDVTDPPGAAVPTVDTRSGGPGSSIAWQELGRAGKRFVTEGPRKSDIEVFTGRHALEPIRVYAGLRAADTPDEQAEAALADLIRMDAFSRSMLVIATPTGTGWVDNNGIAPLEYMHDGDIATVAVQYSYLESPFSLVLEPGRSQASAAALFRTVYRYWKGLPEDSRPRLYLFGLSLVRSPRKTRRRYTPGLGIRSTGPSGRARRFAIGSGAPFSATGTKDRPRGGRCSRTARTSA